MFSENSYVSCTRIYMRTGKFATEVLALIGD